VKLTYLLDTNMFSYIVKGNSPAARAEFRRLAQDPDTQLCISVITEAEVRYGMAKRALSPARRDAIEGLFANLEILAMSERITARAATTGGYWIANATLYSRELLKGLEVSASVYNLFDKHYADPVAADFVQDTITQDGRSFRVKLNYSF